MEEVKDVMVRNLPLDMLGPELENLFSEVGPIKKVAVIHHKKTPGDGSHGTKGLSRGFGFVKFSLAADALEAIKLYNGKDIRGRKIAVELASKDKKNVTKSGNAAAGGGSINAAFQQAKKTKDEEAKDENSSDDDEESNKESVKKKNKSASSTEAKDESLEAPKKKVRANLKASQQQIEENPQPVIHLHTMTRGSSVPGHDIQPTVTHLKLYDLFFSFDSSLSLSLSSSHTHHT
jgi:hypothetical protein